jgi:hypothetical protein
MKSIWLLFIFWNKEELPEEWKESTIVLIYSYKRAIKQTLVIIRAYKFANYVHNFIQHPTLKDNSIYTGNN